ncbi:MAG: hypothetical protein HPY79_10780 [Bacteroidales bacterium]|nr:hypothetical protein [Bacteroidales bacterium]
MKRLKLSIFFFLVIIIRGSLSAQSDVTLSLCSKYIVPPYISDGQVYKALITGDEIAEFHVTFYGGTVYRIAAATGQTEGNLIFSLYDKERHLLFSNRDYKNSTYWDFKFTSTIDCIIEAELDPSARSGSGLVNMLIGFKQQ